MAKIRVLPGQPATQRPAPKPRVRKPNKPRPARPLTREQLQDRGALGGKKAQELGKGLRFSGARARELGRKGGLTRGARARGEID